MTKFIQRVEVGSADQPLHCLFCGKKVVDSTREAIDQENGWAQPCAHTLFVAHDMGFAYRAKQFNQVMRINEAEFDDDAPDIGESDGIDAFTDGVPLPSAVKIAAYQGPSSLYGTYVGFAPAE